MDTPCYNSSCANPDSGMNYNMTIKVKGGGSSPVATGAAASSRSVVGMGSLVAAAVWGVVVAGAM
jgi:hypothetical protein